MTAKDRIIGLQDHRNNRTSLTDYFSQNEKTVNELVQLAIVEDHYPVQEYASWILNHVAKVKYQEVNNSQALVIDGFLVSKNQTCLRNLCGLLKELPLIDYKEGELLESLIHHLTNESDKVALQVYSLYKLNQFAKKYPDLIHEINQIMELKKVNGLPPSIAVAYKQFNKLKAKHF